MSLGGTSAEVFSRFRWPTFELPPRAIELAESVVDRKDIRICYVVATWGGIRRIPNYGHDADPSYYVAHHLRWLWQFASPFVRKVVVAAPWLPGEPQDGSSKYHEALENAVNGCGIESAILLRRPNIGMSYGSFSDVWNRTKDEGFTHWIFNEDDYVYPVGSFDQILVGKLLSDPTIGYVGGYIRHNHTSAHAGICSGIASAEDLEAVAAKHGGILPHDIRPEMGENYPANQWGQVHWTNQYYKIGKTLVDLVGDGLSCGYIRPRAKLTWYDPPDSVRRPFIAPIQAFEPEGWGLGWEGPKDTAEEYHPTPKAPRFEQKRTRWR